ncbi:MBOAT family O-acyltransferase [Acetanaerobacterium elongatum]|uniref:D-alanyl-lipoteichoic acid acyltransferase DltB, MBOAT superfamily n=1 Tax=Acetanaerobacterium elongatum TaxID=258515 RepID=A0A1G9Z502_9FIRM|nr:MBOAT family O-acyltransferase [Acetanaerobacterium elongatum]SDN16608.1 D-alanyl-lipoteichoic acid acyltransferase DltB, MBOAT superfamily [Acetanaerobacterium elongatum]
MLFNSLSYAIFLPIVFIFYWLLPHKYRWVLLLASSYYFHMSWNVKYIFLILFTTGISYVTALFMEKSEKSKKNKLLLAAAIVTSLGVLFFFKYFNFLSTSVTDILQAVAIPVHPVTLSVLLPVGISFYTFQTLSYVIDVYRGNVPAQRHFGKYATFIAFFPQLVAGPIERTSNLLPQINEERHFDYSDATYGLKIIAWGLFKKMVIADNLALFVDKIYNHPQNYHGLSLLLATVFFAFQIYCDFSGYSDIAVGSANLFGIHMINNFKSPYFSASVKEFWSRWHISLSTWFRDYVYIPLGGNRVSKARHYFNLMVTFLLSGLWHGANWTFVIWGGVHGAAQIVETAFFKKQSKNTVQKHNIRWFVLVCLVFTFSCFAWVFFRAQNMSDALYIFKSMFVGIGNPLSFFKTGFADLNTLELLKLTLYLLVLCVYDYFSLSHDLIALSSKLPVIIRWGLYYFLIFCILYLVPGSSSQFIYFEF